MHRALASDIAAQNIDVVHAAGPMMKHLVDALAPGVRGAWAEKSADIEAALLESIRAGDVVMVKGSNGSRMGPIVAALKRRFAPMADVARMDG